LVATLALVESAGLAPAQGSGSPRARSAEATDCDHDGDAPDGVEFEECGNAPPEPGKILTRAEKAQAREELQNVEKLLAKTCGFSSRDPLTWITLFSFYGGACQAARIWALHLNALVEDPPESAASLVTLPAVQAPTGPTVRCPFGRARCARGRRVVGAYQYALEQETAAAGALATSLNRLSSTPSEPEALYGSSPGAFPTYSRRTQVAAARLYSGLLAAWSDRLKAARARVVSLLDGLGPKARRAAPKTPQAFPSTLLWKNFHNMNVYEIAQLYSDLEVQNVEDYFAAHPGSEPTGQLANELVAGKSTLDQDMYQLYLASEAPRPARAGMLASAAARFTKDADKFATIPGLAAIAPGAPLSAELFGFAVEGVTSSKPKPPAAP
jgi:hypothetical protein